MAEYCSADDIKNRLTPLGYKFAVDRDGDGAVNAVELTRVTQAIEHAGTVIDEAVTARELITASDAREQGSNTLKHLAVDLAAYRVAGHGGRKIPQSLKDAYEDAMERLDRIREGLAVVDLEYPTLEYRAFHPRALNPFGKRRRRTWRS